MKPHPNHRRPCRCRNVHVHTRNAMRTTTRHVVAVVVATLALVVTTFPPPTTASGVLYVASLCGPGLCRTRQGPCLGRDDPACGCAPSRVGQLCVECSDLGYIDCGGGDDGNDANACVCTCYDQDLGDPNNALDGPCSPVVNVTSTLSVVAETSRAYCEAWCSRELGCFANPAEFVYGAQEPPPIRDCASREFIGPPPATVRAAVSVRPPEACNAYGGPDPNAPPENATWTACSGHGTWDVARYRCGPTCDRGWALADLGPYGIHGEPITSCAVCAPLFGPPPDRERYAPPYCVAPWTPDPLDGVPRVCGGHGAPDSTGNCVCRNVTATATTPADVWQLAPVTVLHEFERLVYVNDDVAGTAYRRETVDVTVNSCVVRV